MPVILLGRWRKAASCPLAEPSACLAVPGIVIDVIIDTLTDEAPLLARIGGMALPHHTGRGDCARHAGAPDRGDPGWRPRDSCWPPHARAWTRKPSSG